MNSRTIGDNIVHFANTIEWNVVVVELWTESQCVTDAFEQGARDNALYIVCVASRSTFSNRLAKSENNLTPRLKRKKQ